MASVRLRSFPSEIATSAWPSLATFFLLAAFAESETYPLVCEDSFEEEILIAAGAAGFIEAALALGVYLCYGIKPSF